MSTVHDQYRARLERRRQQMLTKRGAGWSDMRIAAHFGITRQRVGQILGPKKAA